MTVIQKEWNSSAEIMKDKWRKMCGKRVRQLGRRQSVWDNIKPVQYQKRSTLQFEKILTEHFLEPYRDS